MWLTDGASPLYLVASFPLDPHYNLDRPASSSPSSSTTTAAATTAPAKWSGCATGKWLGSTANLSITLPLEEQLVCMRSGNVVGFNSIADAVADADADADALASASTPSQVTGTGSSGAETAPFRVSLLVFARPAHWLQRQASFTGALATQVR